MLAVLFLDGLISSIIIGGIAGWLAGLILRGKGYGILPNILVGIVGGALANVVLGVLIMIGLSISPTNLIGRIITSTAGAVLLVYLLQRFDILRKK